MECTIGVWLANGNSDGWPTDAVCSGDVPLTLYGQAALLWRERTQGRSGRKYFDHAAGAVLADRLEEYPDESSDPVIAAHLCGYLRRALRVFQETGVMSY
jgi:hypothetical protein